LASRDGSKEFKTIEARYGEQSIKDRLRDEVFKKCAYCESSIEAVAYPHIEHIRPKSKNRHLTFEWSNLTLACPACNIQKGHTEPTDSNFVNPYTDNPEARFSFIGPLIAPIPNDLGARNMINWLDLNRTELVVSRAEIVGRILSIFEEAIKLPISARREFLDLALSPLKSKKNRHSRVAECVTVVFEDNYAPLLLA
jgi:uncharacterized protein (TIGR02646 family)